MFTATTNVNSSAVSATAVARPAFQLMNTPTNHQTLVSASPTNPSWRLTTPTPTVVSILNEYSPTLYIASQPSAATTNIIRQSLQTVRQVSPSFAFINNSNATLTGHAPALATATSNPPSAGICVDTSTLGRLATPTIAEQKVRCPRSARCIRHERACFSSR